MNRLFSINGEVLHGKKRGKKLGFPTANISADLSTPQGTFISEVIINGKTYQAITFIGTVDTFNENDFGAEAYILDFDQDIYGAEITVNILRKLRDNKKFESEQTLIEQMKIDEVETRDYFSSHSSRQEV